ncbi:Serine/threonine-protein kinase PrkC [Botrimarina colliarenosi]|uniref:Serine/threonine-protein kinase PrkC n=1 Tax=Botrimarina colliarenosi TaxID=2528001 RepID=A0A5C6AGL1_9BACT|nr:serine/threonine-protein kinase [Botrimarina colliarenosi]TWT99182.1 Serine/threonine-protein kinase PrkC [Botrimarina colliarenosi]
MPEKRLRPRSRLGKYVIEKRLAEGGFATVYQARDTIEGVRVAIKAPHTHLMDDSATEQFRREVRLIASLDHPNVLPLKSADVIDGVFVIVTSLAAESLGDRLERRLATKTALTYADQMLAGLAYAHELSIAHCDVKPDNFLLFTGGRVRLGDFGIARIAQRTLRGSGAGTVGYVAPEQALGAPSVRSDVFSMGLTLWRMLSGQLPAWPYRWPLEGHDRLKRLVKEEAIDVLRRAIELEPNDRYANAAAMRSAWKRIGAKALSDASAASGRRRRTVVSTQNWRTIQRSEFKRRFGAQLETRLTCHKCEGPVSEAMAFCPWCRAERARLQEETKFPQACPRCHRGMKLDWSYCPWCYGPGFELSSPREYTDKRYTAKCGNGDCDRKLLMPWMRYCPWCHVKVKRNWKIEGVADRCNGCGWGVVGEFWSSCPWCGKGLRSLTGA